MATRLIFLLIYLLSHGMLSGQIPGKLNTLEVDTRSYQLYSRQNWDSLIILGKASLDQGIDFYYLQYRMGIAYYEKEQYARSIRFFEQVLAVRPEDQTAQEYLYFAYLFSGRETDARCLVMSFTDKLRVRIGLPSKEPVFGSIGAEVKTYRFDDYEVDARPFGPISQSLRKELFYTNINFSHRIGSRLRMYHGLSYITGLSQVNDGNQPVFGYDEDLHQYQYYLGTNWHLKKGMELFGAFHFVHTNLNGRTPSRRQNPDLPNRPYLYSEYLYQYVGYVRFSWWHSFFNFRGYGSVSNFGKEIQILPGLGVDVYPVGNTNFYIRTDVRWQFAPDNTLFNPGLVLKQKMGAKLWKHLWGEVFYQIGKVSNYVDDEGFVVYNAFDPIDWWYGAKLNFYFVDDRLQPFYIFQQYRQTNYYRVGTAASSVGYFTSTHLFGIQWKF